MSAKYYHTELVTAKIAPDWDYLFVDFESGMKLMVNRTSLGNTIDYIGEEVQGITIEGQFNICREHIHSTKGKLFGFILRDEIDEDFILITLIDNKKVGKTISVNREDIMNY